MNQSIARLPDLQDSQMEMALLRSCLALPKVSFSLRSCPPDYIKQGTAEWDNTMRDALSDLAGGPLSDWGWLKASLPSSRGSLNIRSASLHAPAAYISSTTQSRNLVTGSSVVIITSLVTWLVLFHHWLKQRQSPNGYPWRRLTSPSASDPSPIV